MKKHNIRPVFWCLLTICFCFSYHLNAVNTLGEDSKKALMRSSKKKKLKRVRLLLDKKIQKGFSQQQISTTKNTHKKKKNDWALASLLSSTVGIIIPFLGFIAGIILGFIALKKIKTEPDIYGGKVMAIIGIVIGLIFTASILYYLTL